MFHLRPLASFTVCLAILALASAASAQVVSFDVTSGTGTDTLHVGRPESIVIRADAPGQNIAAFTFPLTLAFTPTNLIGPIALGSNLSWSSGSNVFEVRTFNSAYGTGANPDTLLLGFVDMDTHGFNGPAELARITFTPIQTGTITIDTTALPPFNHLSAVDQNALELLHPGSGDSTWRGPYTIHVLPAEDAPPVITECGAGLMPEAPIQGDKVTATVVAHDPDAGPEPLQYFIAGVSGTPNPVPVVAPEMIGSQFHWQTTAETDQDAGFWECTIGVTDGLDTTYCDLGVIVQSESRRPFRLSMSNMIALFEEPTVTEVTFTQLSSVTVAGGFDLQISYDTARLVLTDVSPGPALTAHGWEYFAFDTAHTPPGVVRIVAVADINDGAHHPDGSNPNGPVALLHFTSILDLWAPYVTTPLRFQWTDCGDNTVSSRTGEILYVASEAHGGIVDYDGSQIMCLEPDPDGYHATVVCDSCSVDTNGIEGRVTFENGAIKLVVPICDRGDINLNGLSYEIADMVLMGYYLLYGESVLDPVYWQDQEDNADIDQDGVPWTLWDHCYMYRIIEGKAAPNPDCGGDTLVIPVVGTIGISLTRSGDTVIVEAANDRDVDELWMQLSYSGCEIDTLIPTSRIIDAPVSYVADAGLLTAMVFAWDPHPTPKPSIAAGTGPILRIMTSGPCDVEVVAVHAADPEAHIVEWPGYVTAVDEATRPSAFRLYPNYPNPFNPSTTLAADFPAPAEYTLTIYNVAGQMVRRFGGSAPAGRLEVVWDGRDDAGRTLGSGVYFCCLQAGDHEAVHKMVLMK